MDKNTFKAGGIKDCLPLWQQLTSDENILDIVRGYRIEFLETGFQDQEPKTICFSPTETSVVQSEVAKLLNKGVIVLSEDEPGQFVSNIFIRPKKRSWSL